MRFMIIKPDVIAIDPDNIEHTKIAEAARIIRKGGLVAFPTETVYGLGANALDRRACLKLFKAKNRPFDDPLIVHIANKKDVFKLAREIPDTALKLIDKFWPGPLTLIFKKSRLIPKTVTAGLHSVALRMPGNDIALAIIRESQVPIAAPSANLFGRPSPTTAKHVLEDLNGRIDLLVDGGPTQIGVESTILDLTQDCPYLLRPGKINREELEEIIPGIKIYDRDKILSPGMYPQHYSPKAKVMLIEGNSDVQVEKINNLAAEFSLQGYYFGILAKEENKNKYGEYNVKLLRLDGDLTNCGTNLFSALREFDRQGVDIIFVEGVREEGLGIAIMDRLRKAGGKLCKSRIY
jgi:L-threonylcarbamoyladenylate synthase